jgi:transcription antitermination factor NusG
VCGHLEAAGLAVVPAWTVRKVVRRRKPGRERRALLPGYVFFISEGEPRWEDVRKCRDVVRVLEYGDGSRSLRGKDLEFVKLLKQAPREIGIARAVEVGKKIRIIDGPFADCGGKIVKVNKRNRSAAVQIEGEDTTWTVWVSFEIVREGEG